MIRNYRWLETVENTLQKLKNNVFTTESTDYYWREELDGTIFKIEDYITDNYIFVRVFPFENGSKYELCLKDSDNNYYGSLTVVKNGDKISFSRERDFLKGNNDKPVNTEFIQETVDSFISKINSYKQLENIIEDYKSELNIGQKRKLAGIYLKGKDISLTGNETTEELKEIANKILRLTDVTNSELFKTTLEKVFNITSEKLYNILWFSMTNDSMNSLIVRCIDEGLMEDEYLYIYSYGYHFYKIAKETA